MNIKKYLNPKKYWFCAKNKLKKKYNISYSQCGEDLIIDFALKTLKIKKPSYIDIGANDPIIFNNTYLFYKNGCTGICIEPDPFLFKKIKSQRRNDTTLNIGIGANNKKQANFYIISSKTLNTFSKEEAKALEKNSAYGIQKIKKIIKIPLKKINEIAKQHDITKPDIISIDTEGFDLTILKSINFNEFRPKIICVETTRCIKKNKIKKDYEINNLLIKNNYFLYADTFINGIFIDNKIWAKKFEKIN